jgi:hypothetical protein
MVCNVDTRSVSDQKTSSSSSTFSKDRKGSESPSLKMTFKNSSSSGGSGSSSKHKSDHYHKSSSGKSSSSSKPSSGSSSSNAIKPRSSSSSSSSLQLKYPIHKSRFQFTAVLNVSARLNGLAVSTGQI